jgi:hypothetical protein
MTILRFPLDRARPSKCGRIVCCDAAGVLVLPVVQVERCAEIRDERYAIQHFEMTGGDIPVCVGWSFTNELPPA